MLDTKKVNMYIVNKQVMPVKNIRYASKLFKEVPDNILEKLAMIVSAKIGTKYIDFIVADENIFKSIPVNKNINANIYSISILNYKEIN